MREMNCLASKTPARLTLECLAVCKTRKRSPKRSNVKTNCWPQSGSVIVLALGLMSLLAGLIAAPLAALVNQANWLAAKALLFALAAFSKFPGGYVYVENPRFERPPVCEITALELGEGAAIHLRAGGGNWLLDCGGVRDYGAMLLPYLRSRGVNRLDGVVLTHGDSAHIGATRAVFDDFHPRWVADIVFGDRSPSRRDRAVAGVARRRFHQC